jgi:uncharacterized protein
MGVFMKKVLRLLLFFASTIGLILFIGLLLIGNYAADVFIEKRISTNVVQTDDELFKSDFENIQMPTEDQLTINAYYHPSTNGAAVILLHEYRASHKQMIPYANLLVTNGYGVILFDFRAHGESSGEMVSFGKYEVLDVDAAYKYLIDQPGIDPEKIGILGNSMGGATAILYAAQNEKIKAVITQCPIVSMSDQVRYQLKRMNFPMTWLEQPFIEFWLSQKIGAPLDTFSSIKQITSIAPRPVFIMIGGEDDLVDPDSIQSLYQAAGEPKTLWYDPEVKHVDFYNTYPQEFEERILEFFSKYLQ